MDNLEKDIMNLQSFLLGKGNPIKWDNLFEIYGLENIRIENNNIYKKEVGGDYFLRIRIKTGVGCSCNPIYLNPKFQTGGSLYEDYPVIIDYRPITETHAIKPFTKFDDLPGMKDPFETPGTETEILGYEIEIHFDFEYGEYPLALWMPDIISFEQIDSKTGKPL